MFSQGQQLTCNHLPPQDAGTSSITPARRAKCTICVTHDKQVRKGAHPFIDQINSEFAYQSFKLNQAECDSRMLEVKRESERHQREFNEDSSIVGKDKKTLNQRIINEIASINELKSRAYTIGDFF